MNDSLAEHRKGINKLITDREELEARVRGRDDYIARLKKENQELFDDNISLARELKFLIARAELTGLDCSDAKKLLEKL